MRLPDIALRGFKDVDRLGNVTIIKAPYYGGYKLRFGEMREGAVYKVGDKGRRMSWEVRSW